MRVFGRPFRKTFFVAAIMGLSNWGFWLPASLPAATAVSQTQRRIATFPLAKPAVRLPASAVAESTAKISLVAENESTPNVSPSQRRNAGAGALRIPTSNLTTPNSAVKQTDQAEKAKSQASAALGSLNPGFIQNRGQFDDQVKYTLRGKGKTVWLTDKGLVFDAQRGKPESSQKEFHLLDSSASLPISDGQDPLQEANLNHDAERLVFNEEFINANSGSKVEATEPQQGSYNFISGNDPTKWQTHVQAYGQVIYHDKWEGIDVRVFRNGPNLEQEFIVRPEGDLSRVQIAYRGINDLSISQDGSLEINTAFGKIRETAPRIYQEIAGRRVAVSGRFKLLSETSYTFEVSKHSANYTLLIDPTLLYSTFLGGSAGNNFYNGNGEVATGIGVDAAGEAIVAGFTASTDFPTTTGAFQVSPPSGSFVTKLSAAGSALVYSTYLGYSDTIQAIAVDSVGNAYVTGYTSATYYGHIFPTTPNAYWPTNSSQQCSPTDFFVTELNTTGSQLVYSSCFNITSDTAYTAEYGYYPRGITIDMNGRVYVAGGAGNGLPTTANAYQPAFPGDASAFLSVFDTTISGPTSLVYSTYLGPTGGSSNALAYGVAVDSFGEVYLTGNASNGFPVTPGAFQTAHSSASTDVFIAKLDPSVSGLVGLLYSTYIGGNPSCSGGCGGSSGSAITVDTSGNAYVTGVTQSPYFPTTAGAFQTSCPGYPGYVFVSKLNSNGSQLNYSTCLAGNGYANSNSAGGIAVDSLGNVYVTGGFRAQTQSTFPVTPDAFQNSLSKLSGDYSETFLTKLSPDGSSLIYSTYFGGSGDDVATGVAIDQVSDAYIAGHTSSGDLPTRSPFQLNMNGTGDAFVAKFSTGGGGALSIVGVYPSAGGTSGSITLAITGSGFHFGAIASLNCPGNYNLVGTNPSIGPDGKTFSATFSLVGLLPGACGLTIMNVDGTSASLSEALTVVQAGTEDIQLDLFVHNVRGGGPAIFVAGYTNRGVDDSKAFRLWISFPNFFSWSPPPGHFPASSGQQNGTIYVGFDIPSVPAGTSGWIPFQVNAPTTLPFDSPFQVQAWMVAR